MREILFRGKEKGQWVYGYYWKFEQNGKEVHVIRDGADNLLKFNHICEPESIGQYTGLTDKNGKKIFEGDIISYFGRDLLNSEVVFYKNAFMFRFISEYVQKIRQQKYDLIFQNVSICGEVIGNIHDNPELVEG